MYEKPFTPPRVGIGDEVLFAPSEDTPETGWNLAKITRVKIHGVTKATAVDLRILSAHGDMPRADVRHIGDPSLRKYPPRNDSGVFRLTERQIQINRMLTEWPVALQAVQRRMDALEQTFKAVMETLRSESQRTNLAPPGVGKRLRNAKEAVPATAASGG